MIGENLDDFLGDFAVAATLTTTSGSTNLNVIFDENYMPLEIGAEGREITAYCKASDVLGVVHSDTLTVDAIAYRIAQVRPLDDGKFTELLLKL